MPLQIIRQDITKVCCDAIVNAANQSLLGGGGVDGAIHRAAGPELLAECRTLGGCKTGQAKLTKGYRLPAKYVIHTVGPVWRGGSHGEKELLESCYRTSLELAAEYGCKSVAFPLISSGVYGYPKDQALRVAVDTISGFLAENEMEVYLTIFGRDDYQISSKLFADIQSYIDDNYAAAHSDDVSVTRERAKAARKFTLPFFGRPPKTAREPLGAETIPHTATSCPKERPMEATAALTTGEKDDTLASILDQIDESFSQMLLRMIDEKGMTDAQCYKKANIDRKLFSKIRGDIHYKPSKSTALAFAIALELSLNETQDMLMKAGYALSHSSKFDLIIEYFIRHGNYDIFQINEALFAFDQSLLGG